MKKSITLFILSLFLINFISAYYGSYTSFSLSDLLDSIDSSTMILGAAFIISFAFINFALSKVFKDKYGEPNKATAGVVSFVIALLITYGINKTGFDFEGLFFDIGFSEGVLYTILPLVLLAGIIFLGIKFGFRVILIVLGGLLFIISLTDLIYSKGIAIVISLGLIGLGIFLPNFGGYLDYKKRLSEQKYGQKINYKLKEQMLKNKYKSKGDYQI